LKKLFVVLGVLVLAGFTFGQGITGSAHDFSASGWASGQICIACHTPHNADITVTNSPLWNHELTATVFTLYSTTSLDATDLGQPDGISKLCLSCHDGSVALDSFGGNTGTNFIVSTADMGDDLSNDHPISFTYDTTLSTTDGELLDPSTALSGLGGTIEVDLLSGGKMECSSCHDVHNSTGLANLLVMSNVGSALCLTCHDK
jgi:predicted CXXCH cytochrome family protein